MTLINKNTWCPHCLKPNIEREEKIIRTGGLYPKMFLIIYRCSTFDCYHETIIDVKVTNKLKKRIRAMDKERIEAREKLRAFDEWEKTHPPKQTDLKALKDKLKK